MIKIDHFNLLPPRSEDIVKVRHILANGREYKLTELINKSKLTKTQVLCSLQHLANSGDVMIFTAGKTKTFKLASEPEEQQSPDSIIESKKKPPN
ncbi:MAG: hypothetical protein P0Y58_12905 [Candidatus Pseudomonas phytovorans]|uniref:Uncharacterized protein n=1 Tax=Candidatus Pseudomonas phytovorans TaxID=3121377 RepID=A0AAJ5WLU6_9PSED|nr:hypothetical protein [Pseudomonas sp.]WEK33040.1 MAG: hypothetical protein P0Y58_12905 [Pseudomonas sp.]